MPLISVHMETALRIAGRRQVPGFRYQAETNAELEVSEHERLAGSVLKKLSPSSGSHTRERTQRDGEMVHV